jgi:hypothetical protein
LKTERLGTVADRGLGGNGNNLTEAGKHPIINHNNYYLLLIFMIFKGIHAAWDECGMELFPPGGLG